MRPARALFAGMALALVVIAVLVAVTAHRDRPAALAFRGTPVEPPKAARDAVLEDADGAPAHVLRDDAAVTFLFFGYTHCPDACPLALASLGRAYRSLTPNVAARTRIVFVTVDPARDTAPVVRRYVRAFDPHIVGLTGAPGALARVWNAYGVTVDARSREIGHGDAIYAIDRSRRVVLVYPSDASAADLAHDATAFVRS